MAKQIGKFNCTAAHLLTDQEGNMTFSVAPDPEHRLVMHQIIQEYKRLREKGSKLVITVQEYRNIRSVQQNNMMWGLLEIMARHMSGGRTGDVTAEDCYINMLEQYGAKIDYFECLPQAVDSLRPLFRVVKVVEHRESNGKDTVMCKCVHGSSSYDTQEMSLLLEGILDKLDEMGVDSSEEAYLREEFYASQGA